MEVRGKLHPPADLAPVKNLGTHWIGDLPPWWHYTSIPCSEYDRFKLVLGTRPTTGVCCHVRRFYLYRVACCRLVVWRSSGMWHREVQLLGALQRSTFSALLFPPATTLYLSCVHFPVSRMQNKFPTKRCGKFAYLGMTLTSRYCIHNAMTSILYSENACYHWVQNCLCSSLLSKNIELKMYRTTVIPVWVWNLVVT